MSGLAAPRNSSLGSGFALGLLLLAVAAAARADDSSSNSALFTRLDVNADGHVSADEIPKEHARLFSRLVRSSDADGDGKLSPGEFEQGMKVGASNTGGVASPPARFERTNSPAEGARRDPEAMFRMMDRDGDGFIVADDAPGPLRGNVARMIASFDAEDDGRLSREEFARASDRFAAATVGQPPAAARLAPSGADARNPLVRLLDANADGELSSDEIASAPRALRRLDRDGDGRLTRDEATPPMGAAPARGSLERRPQVQEGASNALMAGIFRRADANGDGQLSRDEAPERMRDNFDRTDANGDGFIDEREMERVMEFIERVRSRDASLRPARRGGDLPTGGPSAD